MRSSNMKKAIKKTESEQNERVHVSGSVIRGWKANQHLPTNQDPEPDSGLV